MTNVTTVWVCRTGQAILGVFADEGAARVWCRDANTTRRHCYSGVVYAVKCWMEHRAESEIYAAVGAA